MDKCVHIKTTKFGSKHTHMQKNFLLHFTYILLLRLAASVVTVNQEKFYIAY